jgi:hypothetical protein
VNGNSGFSGRSGTSLTLGVEVILKKIRDETARGKGQDEVAGEQRLVIHLECKRYSPRKESISEENRTPSLISSTK